jgi:hypothetical protein
MKQSTIPIQPYILIPNLIEQSTWGGSYICSKKRLNLPDIAIKKFGQSYELYEDSNVTMNFDTRHHPVIELGNSDNPKQYIRIGGTNDTVYALSDIIRQNPLQVLGISPLRKHGQTIQLLIKFTQAKSNSYQLHVKKEDPLYAWKPKPESWYFFEPGLVTLGIRNLDDVPAYQSAGL